MITRPTTLILGAGASQPYGFPTGGQLRNQILLLTSPSNFDALNLYRELGFTPDNVNFFNQSFKRSGQPSIDSFLEHRKEFIEIGKTSIAMALISKENENLLFMCDGNSWYEFLFKEMATGFIDLSSNKLSVLTFNYDRSLEHFLLTSISNSYGKSYADCKKVLELIPVVHLHGDLGGLDMVNSPVNGMRAYNPTVDLESIKIAASRIKIIHEGEQNKPEFDRARHILSQSEFVCFLGFGYNEISMARLGFVSSPLRHNYTEIKYIHGSSKNLTVAQCQQIDKRCKINLSNPQIHSDYHNYDVLTYLRESGILHHNKLTIN